MHRKSKMVSFMMALALTIPCANGIVSNTDYNVDATGEILTVDEITKNMGLGWNLGNSLESNGITTDAYYSTTTISIDDYEQYWGNPAVTQELITAIKNKGFNTIRIPVTWYEHISNDGNYTIDTAWFNRVKEVVNYAYSQGMYVIINVHHEDWINRSDFTSSYDAMSTELKAVWKQIATEFSTYDQHLIFEGMNEPRVVGNSSISEWSGNDECYKIINQLNNDFVETVRSVSSDYQSTRLLMIPSYAASSYSSVYSSLTIPKVTNSIDSDSDGDDDYIAVSLHAYSPYDFAMGKGDHSTFSDTYKSELDTIFNDIRTTLTNKDIPVIIGEFSASDYDNTQARCDWATYYMTTAKEMGIPCLLWDNNISLNNAKDENGNEISDFNYSEVHGYINRDDANLSWYSNSEPVVNSLLYVMNNNSVVWDSKSTYPINVHADYDSGTEISTNAWCTINDAISLLKENTEIAIKYTDTMPKIALAQGDSWEHWTVVSPYDFDTTNNIAYFSYESIQKAWDSTNGTFDKIKTIDSIGDGLTVSSVKILSTENLETSIEDTIDKYSLSLTGNIGINVYATLCNETIANSDAYAKFTNSLGEVVSQIPITDDLKQSNGTYKFTLEVNSIQMSDEFKVQIVSGEKTSNEVTVSVKQYCEYIINNSSKFDTTLVDLVKSMLNYGAYAQTQFNSTSTMANENLNDTDKLLPNDSDINVSSYKYTLSGTVTGLNVDSASLVLNSETSIRCYFSLDSGKNIDDFSFTVDGNTVTPLFKNNKYYIEVPNIKATDLDNTYVIKMASSNNQEVLTLNYSALSYIYSVLNDSSFNDNLKNVVKALYVYNQKADDYFSNIS